MGPERSPIGSSVKPGDSLETPNASPAVCNHATWSLGRQLYRLHCDVLSVGTLALLTFFCDYELFWWKQRYGIHLVC